MLSDSLPPTPIVDNSVSDVDNSLSPWDEAIREGERRRADAFRRQADQARQHRHGLRDPPGDEGGTE